VHKKNYLATMNFFRIAFDIFTIIEVYFVSAIIYNRSVDIDFMGRYLWMLATYIVIYVLLMLFLRMYDVTTFTYMDRTITRVTVSVFVPAMCISSMIFLLKIESASRLFFLLLMSLSFVILLGLRILSLKLKSPSSKTNDNLVLFIGQADTYETYKAYIGKTSIRCVFDSNMPYNDERIDTLRDFENYITDHSIDEVIIAYDPRVDFPFEEYMSVCDDMGITFRLIFDFFEMPISKRFVSSIGTLPIITYHSVSKNQMQLFFKKVLDMGGAILAIILSSPVLLVAAIAIKIDSPGPVFFRQKRIGRNGKSFQILKFRSMYIDAEERKKELAAQNKIKSGLMFKIDNDPRITKVGKISRKMSIDELPQFINVLKGEMSIVGTRPPTVDEVKQYERRHRRRISINPGITGMWQVSGRSDIIDFEQVVQLDTKYIDEWSLALDIKLIFKTIGVVFARKGAH
jgi:exopolysaccharide biosynthesis polyprenyl glycosylphosphotransferase